ncbi:unnamed protein product [Cyprideis torosa]|uniref:Acyl carrier protein, mitochondrial n=1 Tax=Cyprideis torosa TaxID=163714 RepID=A0A7R8WHF3_9CRUS|nr:unnamed protein product [Cyprideis torosa]CAG0899262.1 unnamed protein product [Cyprideis torosa]
MWSGVFVFCEVRKNTLAGVALELLGKGRDLADARGVALTAVVLGSDLNETASQLIAYGADVVYCADHPLLNEYCEDRYIRILANVIEEKKPEIVLAGATAIGRSCIPGVATLLDAGLTADCTGLEIRPDDGALLQTRPAFGGNIMATIECPRSRPQMATVRPKVMKPCDFDPSREGLVHHLELNEADLVSLIRVVESVEASQGNVNIQESDILISGGRGIENDKGVELIRQLAEVMGADVAASRAVVDAGMIPYPHQVGQTGKTVAPKLYIACGISGAVQHVAGMQSAEAIVAINRDPDAPIFDVADYGIVGDLNEILPKLIGGSRGIGRAICLRLAEQGAKVYVNYVSRPEAAQETQEAIVSQGGKAEILRCNIGDGGQVQEAMKSLLNECGRLDILVNNAGITRDGLIALMKESDWDTVLNTNLKGTFLCSKVASRAMMKKRWGRIINITSVIGHAGNTGQANYAAAKAGIVGLSKSLAREYASRGITVNCVAPGYIETDMTSGLDEEVKKALLQEIPLADLGRPEDVAAAVAFLASDDARYITGQTIHLSVEKEKVVPNASFVDDLGADSLDLVELIMAMEEGFDVEIPDEEAEKIATVQDAIDFYGMAAAIEAMADSGFTVTEEHAGRVGVITGCGMGGLPTIEKYHRVLFEKGPRKVTPFFIPMVIPNMPSGHISMHFGTKGPNLALTTACAAGTHAVGEAYNHIKNGVCDMVISGGTEAVICEIGIAGFSSMKALSTNNERPQQASRPFDKDRDGFVMSEGAGMLILEEMASAKRRGATIYAEVIGYGLSSDAYHVAAPPEDGAGAVRSMRMALESSGIRLDEVDYVNAHGTSTPLNDRCETQALKNVFGEHAYRMAISSTKSMTGHMLGAAGGIESVFTALSVRNQIAPPTINLVEASPDCDLDYVPNVARKMEIRNAMSNSFGFGGTNGVIIMQKYHDGQ